MVEAVSYTGSRDPGRGIGWSKSQRKKRGLVRSLTLRPPVSSTAGSMPQGLPFPLGFISHSLWRKESKGEKVRSYAVAHAPAGEHSSTAVHVARASHSLFGYLKPCPVRSVRMKKAERPKREKGMAVCLEVRIRSSTSVHVNSEPLAALSGMTAVALPWVSLRVPH